LQDRLLKYKQNNLIETDIIKKNYLCILLIILYFNQFVFNSFRGL
jgi:hypothetical protein